MCCCWNICIHELAPPLWCMLVVHSIPSVLFLWSCTCLEMFVVRRKTGNIVYLWCWRASLSLYILIICKTLSFQLLLHIEVYERDDLVESCGKQWRLLFAIKQNFQSQLSWAYHWRTGNVKRRISSDAIYSYVSPLTRQDCSFLGIVITAAGESKCTSYKCFVDSAWTPDAVYSPCLL